MAGNPEAQRYIDNLSPKCKKAYLEAYAAHCRYLLNEDPISIPQNPYKGQFDLSIAWVMGHADAFLNLGGIENRVTNEDDEDEALQDEA